MFIRNAKSEEIFVGELYLFCWVLLSIDESEFQIQGTE